MSDESRYPDGAEPRPIDGGALRALAHPLRIEIYDILSQYGPQTASTLAELTGESTGSTSYHLRALAKHELIREVEGRGNARERWWERPKGSVTFGSPEGMKTPAGRAATQFVMNEFFTRRHEQLMRYIADGLRNPDEVEDTGMITTATARLTPEQMKGLTTRLTAIIDEVVAEHRDQVGDDVRTVTIRADVFALPEKGPRT
ncbi:helix-turn-helix domain-containing protein [Microbacterium sp. SYP-A9085]|uniref:winged helix-turn-helix domain-containing protein n=1 Tax=Microbacterium sp. SYP-A9085 TaxID=2664454 RepID=UPI00129B58A4|nr:helix-turn-helix domain-containing protein [Microbacterium sp. SYP-A9085]MRH29920.1 helix-turn-helix domain-containing protein [Microbacterium sp. SYP-A9085]